MTIAEVLNIYLTLKNNTDYIKDKIIIFSFIIIFAGLHFLFDIKKLYDFIIKYRYYISTIFLISLTILQYSNSKISAISEYVFEPEKSTRIFGTNVTYRVDEFGIETPLSISQYKNNFNYFGEFLRGTETDMSIVVHVPIKDLIQIARIFNIGYLFLSPDYAIAFCWNLKIIATLLVTFELIMIITNKNKYLSFIGSIMIAFSSAMLFWGISEFLFFGELIIVLIDKYMNTDKYKNRIFISIFIAWSAISYIFTLYPGFIISLGYVYLSLFIWIVLKNIKTCKFSKKDIIIILFVIILISMFLLRYFIISRDAINSITNTSYPGDRIETGGEELSNIVGYAYSYLFNIYKIENFLHYVNINSFFPIPIILAFICIVKSKKHWKFLIPTIFIAIMQTIWCIFGYPEVLAKLTLMSSLTAGRCAVSLSLINVYILMYLLSNKEDIKINNKTKIIIVEIMILLILNVKIPIEEYEYNYLSCVIIIYLIFILEVIIIVNYNNKKFYNALIVLLCMHTLIIFWKLDITKGAGAITNTEFSKKVQSILEEDDTSLWIVDKTNDFNVLPSYLVANGARTVNSVNTYPNEDFYKIILKEEFEAKRTTWNRYAHIVCKISDTVGIKQSTMDILTVSVNNNTLKELGVKYIVSYRGEDELEREGVNLDILYSKTNRYNEEESIYIYELK